MLKLHLSDFLLLPCSTGFLFLYSASSEASVYSFFLALGDFLHFICDLSDAVTRTLIKIYTFNSKDLKNILKNYPASGCLWQWQIFQSAISVGNLTQYFYYIITRVPGIFFSRAKADRGFLTWLPNVFCGKLTVTRLRSCN